MEYIEREDEFDIHPSSVLHKRRLDQEDEDVDVLTIEPVKEAGGEDESDEATDGERTFTMPVLLDISESESEEEIVMVGPGTMRRKSPGEGRDWSVPQGPGSSDEKVGGSRRPGVNGVANKKSRRRRAD